VFAIRVPNVIKTLSLNDLADVLAGHVREALPSGPYAVAGWCASGVLALEVARKLDASGKRVAFAAVLDARAVFLPRMNPVARRWVRCWHYAQRIGFFLKQVAKNGVKPVRTAVDGRLDRARLVGRKMRGADPPGSLVRALKDYNPPPWGGRVVHIWAEERPRGRYRDPQFTWGAISPDGFKFYEVPGTHMTMLEEPAVGRIAMILERELRAARLASSQEDAMAV